MQFIYGEDGHAAEFIENLSIPLIEMSNDTMEKKYNFFHKTSDDIQKKERIKNYIDESVLQDMGN